MTVGFANSDVLHPLSKYAKALLLRMSQQPHVMALEINPGVQDRFVRGGLAEFIEVPNPYKTKTARARAMVITPAGRRELLGENWMKR